MTASTKAAKRKKARARKPAVTILSYDKAVAAGFKGTEAEWLKSLSPSRRRQLLKNLTDVSATLSDKLLKTRGWEILDELRGNIIGAILNTAQFVLPVDKELETILTVVKEPEAFKADYQLLNKNIVVLKTGLDEIGVNHDAASLNKDEAETPMDALPAITELSTAYAALMGRYETDVQPLIDKLSNVLREEYIPTLPAVVEEAPAQ